MSYSASLNMFSAYMASSLENSSYEREEETMDHQMDDDALFKNSSSFISMATDYYWNQPYLDHPYAMFNTISSSLSSVPFDQQTTSFNHPLASSFIDIEDVSCNTTVVTVPMDDNGSHGNDDPDDGDPWEGSVTRCVCDFQHDDGYMICCDRCGVWQHVDCMGVNRNDIPDCYLCELCNPRPVDKRRAIRLQTIKRQQLESEMSASDSSTDEHRGGGRKKRERKRRNNESDGSTVPAQNRKRTTAEGGAKRNRSSNLINHKMNGSMRGRRNDDSMVCSNSYTNGVLALLATFKDNEGSAAAAGGGRGGEKMLQIQMNQSILKEKRFHLTSFGPDAKGIESTDMIQVNQVVAEFTGRIMTSEEYDLDNHMDSFVPFVVRCEGPSGVNICIDSTISENDVKFVRCSCTPNAKIIHVIEKNTIRFYICATKNIAEAKEITIPFHFDFQKCNYEVQCACSRVSCSIVRFFKLKSHSRPIRIGRKIASHLVLDEKPSSSNDNVTESALTCIDLLKLSRRSDCYSDLLKNKMVNADVGSDVTLMNALTSASAATSMMTTANDDQIKKTAKPKTSSMSLRNEAAAEKKLKRGEKRNKETTNHKMKNETKISSKNKLNDVKKKVNDRLANVRSNRLKEKLMLSSLKD